MFASIKRFLSPLFLFSDTSDQIDFESDISIYLLLGVALVFAFLVHCGLLIFSLLIGFFPLRVFNGISLAVYCVCFFHLRKKRYAFIGVLLSIEVTLYTCFSVYWFGFLNYDFFYLVIIVVMQIVIPYAAAAIRVALGVLICLVVPLIIVLVSYYPGPGMVNPFDFSLTCFNIAVGFVGITVELVIGNVIQKIIEVSRQMRMETLQTHAYTDSLTGLYNRHYAEQYFSLLSKTANRGTNVAALLDIDDFKQINDTYGHAAGDKVLVDLAYLMLSEFRKTDTVIRWGGEEFLVILNSVTLALARSILDKLRQKIAAHTVETGGPRLNFRVTIGIAPLDTDHIEESIARCDENLYRGKRNGKDQVAG
ncbi:MAG: GGDEF domain-containing protein [Spirochaetaceae bacterium]|jgi:diguanylate cyclase (GGDEF)-like protein|nr:GGDEF domain-containing protein [Spirochaetaceae bacterium]